MLGGTLLTALKYCGLFGMMKETIQFLGRNAEHTPEKCKQNFLHKNQASSKHFSVILGSKFAQLIVSRDLGGASKENRKISEVLNDLCTCPKCGTKSYAKPGGVHTPPPSAFYFLQTRQGNIFLQVQNA